MVSPRQSSELFAHGYTRCGYTTFAHYFTIPFDHAIAAGSVAQVHSDRYSFYFRGLISASDSDACFYSSLLASFCAQIRNFHCEITALLMRPGPSHPISGGMTSIMSVVS